MTTKLVAYAATFAQRHMGRLVRQARRHPVTITLYGEPAVVLLAMEEYEELTGEKVER